MSRSFSTLGLHGVWARALTWYTWVGLGVPDGFIRFSSRVERLGVYVTIPQTKM